MTDAPRLLHVFSTFCAAGPQVRTAALMDGFGADFRHVVVSCDGRTDARTLVSDRVELRVVDLPDRRGLLAGVRAMRALLKDERPDLLLTYNWGAMDAVAAARALGLARHVHHEDGFNADEVDRLKARRSFARRVSLHGTDVVVPSRTLHTIARRSWHLPRVHLIPNGIDPARFARDGEAGARFRAEHGIPEDALVVGFVGHLRPVKNVPRLVAAVAAVPDAALGGRPLRLVVVGEGPRRGAVERAVQRLDVPGRGAVLVGHLDDLRPAYSAFDVLALSSDSEQQPVTLLEAMSAGVPVAATDVGDVAETLPEEARRHVVALGPRATEDLAAALAALCADAGLRERLAAAGRARVAERYSFEAMRRAYRKVYEAALRR